MEKTFQKFCLRWFLLITISSFTACVNNDEASQKNNKVESDNYDSRIANLIGYLNNHHGINMDSCRSTVILQTNKCNSCTKEKLNHIFEDLNSKKHEAVIFVLNSHDKVVDEFLESKSDSLNLKIIVDESRQLTKMGLSFMKNAYVNTCHNRVLSWKFY